MRRRVLLGHVPRGGADDDGQLDFVVELFGDAGIDRIERPRNAGRLLVEPELLLGGGDAKLLGLLGVLLVVHPDGHVLAGAQRGQERGRGGFQARGGPFAMVVDTVERGLAAGDDVLDGAKVRPKPRQVDDTVAFHHAEACALASLEPQQFHVFPPFSRGRPIPRLIL